MMTGWFKRGLIALAGVAISLAGAPANATLSVKIFEGNTLIATVVDGGGADTNSAAGAIDVDVSNFVNPFLTNFTFVSLGASSNGSGVGPSDPLGPGVLTQGGTVIRTTTTGGAKTVTIIASDNNYLLPTGNPKTMSSSGSTTATSAGAGDSRSFVSSFDPSNTIFGTSIDSAGFVHSPVGPGLDGSTQSFNTDETPVDLGFQPTPYTLTSKTVITLGNSAGGSPPVRRRLSWQGTTTVVGTPEPSTLIAVAIALPFLLPLARRVRRSSGTV